MLPRDGARVVTEQLIDRARRRRRTRWFRGTTLVLLGVLGGLTWLDMHGTINAGLLGAAPGVAESATTGACSSPVTDGPLPTWARNGFHPPTLAMPHVLGARGEIVAVLWARSRPLLAPPAGDRANKILWVSKAPLAPPSNLAIAARRVQGGRAVGATQHRTVEGGPGPSIIDMPSAGCWRFTLRWSGHTDSVDLAYSPETSTHRG